MIYVYCMYLIVSFKLKLPTAPKTESVLQEILDGGLSFAAQSKLSEILVESLPQLITQLVMTSAKGNDGSRELSPLQALSVISSAMTIILGTSRYVIDADGKFVSKSHLKQASRLVIALLVSSELCVCGGICTFSFAFTIGSGKIPLIAPVVPIDLISTYLAMMPFILENYRPRCETFLFLAHKLCVWCCIAGIFFSRGSVKKALNLLENNNSKYTFIMTMTVGWAINVIMGYRLRRKTTDCKMYTWAHKIIIGIARKLTEPRFELKKMEAVTNLEPLTLDGDTLRSMSSINDDSGLINVKNLNDVTTNLSDNDGSPMEADDESARHEVMEMGERPDYVASTNVQKLEKEPNQKTSEDHPEVEERPSLELELESSPKFKSEQKPNLHMKNNNLEAEALPKILRICGVSLSDSLGTSENVSTKSDGSLPHSSNSTLKSEERIIHEGRLRKLISAVLCPLIIFSLLCGALIAILVHPLAYKAQPYRYELVSFGGGMIPVVFHGGGGPNAQKGPICVDGMSPNEIMKIGLVIFKKIRNYKERGLMMGEVNYPDELAGDLGKPFLYPSCTGEEQDLLECKQYGLGVAIPESCYNGKGRLYLSTTGWIPWIPYPPKFILYLNNMEMSLSAAKNFCQSINPFHVGDRSVPVSPRSHALQRTDRQIAGFAQLTLINRGYWALDGTYFDKAGNWVNSEGQGQNVENKLSVICKVYNDVYPFYCGSWRRECHSPSSAGDEVIHYELDELEACKALQANETVANTCYCQGC